MPSEERRRRSRRIVERLFATAEFRSAASVAFYASWKSEVATHEAIRRALAEGKRVWLPKVATAPRRLLLAPISDPDRELRPGAYGILEPPPERAVEVVQAQVDLVVVPGVAFGEHGERLGYGQGYYDRLLAQLPDRVVTVGLAFEVQVFPCLPQDPHDVPVQLIITEERILRYRPGT